jgi:hypothetical protein
MPYITDHQQKFTDLKFHIENQDQLRRQANGGNSILFSYPPDEEQQYIEKAKELYIDKAEFISVGKLLVQFIDKEGWESFQEYYNDFKNTPHLIFRSEDPNTDLFDLIIGDIKKACRNDKIPFLIRTGCLFGTGIENVNIMENKAVINLPHPLVIFYPSKIDNGNIYFLNFKPASKYRCMLVK